MRNLKTIENMQMNLFDHQLPKNLSGFRLNRFEVLNWGTFDGRIWKIEPNGANALLTGDVGSGKSTLVDALTTLLVPHQRITYNKAAGAESKERTLYSYVRGEYKNEKAESSQSATPVVLRPNNTYTVLLAHFHNESLSQDITIAQVFWIKNGTRNPERYFIVAQTSLSIKEHFSNFGRDVLDLKKRLKKLPQVELVDSFREYCGKFCTHFGIEQEQALELFYQTISMKSVGNLTDFVRAHMLEKDDVQHRIQELRENFANLNHSHESILKAKKQIELLSPIVSDGVEHRKYVESVADLKSCREALEAYFAQHKALFLQSSRENFQVEINKTTQRIETNRAEATHLRVQLRHLEQSIDGNGGARLKSIADEIKQSKINCDASRKLFNVYEDLIKKLDLRIPREETGFVRNQERARSLLEQATTEINTIDEEKVRRGVELQVKRKEVETVQLEITSLKKRRSNIPHRNLEIRKAICEAIEAKEDQLPFVGELLQICEQESKWEGSLERVLHNFGLSLLVPEHLYAKVTQYAELTQLRGKLVYFRTNLEEDHRRSEAVHPKSLTKKLKIKPDSIFFSWLQKELKDRFDYACCDSVEEFRRQTFAITTNGQLKSGGKRHEKDDRHSIHDRSSFILGWSNEAKIQVLESSAESLIREIQASANEYAKITESQKVLQARREHIRDLTKFESFSDIHWQIYVKRIQDLEEECRSIEEASDLLKTLQQRLASTESALNENNRQSEDLARLKGGLEEKLRSASEQLEFAISRRDALSDELKKKSFERIENIYREAFSGFKLNLQNVDKSQSETRSLIQTRIDSEEKRIRTFADRLVSHMQGFRTEYPAETQDFDSSTAALFEYERFLDKLKQEDLPRHESKFKELLNEGTINSIALLQNHFERGRQEIEEKIAMINRSLREIEYNTGTFIELVYERTLDSEIRDFQQELKQCLSHSFENASLYNEARFLRVKGILDRFNCRQEFADIDRKWTMKVTDVRNWFEFSASERWNEDGKEKEFYSDSSGKSGGQKEKLAYTVLASALAYQFGIGKHASSPRSFRFVVIDEAFGRGSDESTRYGLELFKKLNLQLVVVTPLQKIHVIEDYVNSVHFIHNEEGKFSVIRNISIENYKTEKRNYHNPMRSTLNDHISPTQH